MRRMQAYLNCFQRPPPNRLVTRKLEHENTYDEVAWSEHHWEDTMAKRPEITDTTNHSHLIVSNGSDDSFVQKTPTITINSTLSSSKLGLDDDINQDVPILKKYDTKECFTPVSRGAKPAKWNELKENLAYLNVSNRFTMLEIEPCLESYDCENFYEDHTIINTHKKKHNKKMIGKFDFTLQHSKHIVDPIQKENKMDCKKRCKSCFYTHFPHIKFCNWFEKKKSKKLSIETKLTNLSEEAINLLKIKIQYLETMKDVQIKEIKDSFFQRSQNASDPLSYPDLVGTDSCKTINLEDLSSDLSKLKLRGGGGQKVKKYISDTKNINLVLNSLRSSSVLASLNAHNKCPAKSFCSFCLLRSVIFKINIQKGRQSIKPSEVECQLFKSIEMTHINILKVILDNASQSYPSFSSIITPQWNCSCCTYVEGNNNESVMILDSEDKNRKQNTTV